MKAFVATATAIALLLGAPALAATDEAESGADMDSAEITASGDAATGETVFSKQCVTCHVVVNDEGETLAGSRGRQGPNLYGVTGGPVGSVDDFKYSKGMQEASETDVIWDEENFVAYVQDPTEWLREVSGDEKARSKMSWKVRSEEDAANLFAFLHDLAPYEEE